MGVGRAQAVSEWGRGQANDANLWVFFNELYDLLALDMALINYQEANIWEVIPTLQSLRAAYLDSFVGTIPPMARLHHAVIDAVL